MIVVIVVFDLAPGVDRDIAQALYRQTARSWLGNPDLIEKYYFFDAERRQGGGVYIWPSRAAALRWHDDDYRRRIAAHYGSEPRIQVLDALMHVDPGAARLSEV